MDSTPAVKAWAMSNRFMSFKQPASPAPAVVTLSGSLQSGFLPSECQLLPVSLGILTFQTDNKYFEFVGRQWSTGISMGRGPAVFRLRSDHRTV